jgi:hypothetical protein
MDVGRIYSGGALSYLQGDVHWVRISKGIARYTAAFTPPTSLPEVDEYTVLALDFSGDGSNDILKDASDTFTVPINAIDTDRWTPDSVDWSQADGELTVDSKSLDTRVVGPYLTTPFTCEVPFADLAFTLSPGWGFAGVTFRIDADNRIGIWRSKDTTLGFDGMKVGKEVAGVWTEVVSDGSKNDASGTFKIIWTGSTLEAFYNGNSEYSQDFGSIAQMNVEINVGTSNDSASNDCVMSVPSVDVTATATGDPIFFVASPTRILDKAKPSYAANRHAVIAGGGADLASSGTLDVPSGGYLSLADDSEMDFGSDAWTLEGEVYLDGGSINQAFIGTRDNDGSNEIRLSTYIQSAGDLLAMDIWDSTQTRLVNGTSTGAVPIGEWCHLSICRDGVNFYLSVAGTVENFVGGSTNPIDYNADKFRIGKQVGGFTGTGAPFAGQMRNIHVSRGICRYTTSFTPPTSITVDQYSILALEFVGAAGSTHIGDSAWQDPAGCPFFPDVSVLKSDGSEATNKPLYDPTGTYPLWTADGTNDLFTTALAIEQDFQLFALAHVTANAAIKPLLGDSNAYLGLDASEFEVGYAGTLLTGPGRQIPANDDFEATSIDTERWTETGTGSWIQSGGALAASVTGTVGTQVNGGEASGDFTMKANFSSASFVAGTGSFASVTLRARLDANNMIQVYRSAIPSQQIRVGKTVAGVWSLVYEAADTDTSGLLEIRRVSNSCQCYWNGSPIGAAQSYVGNMHAELGAEADGTAQVDNDWDDIEVLDGSSDPIYVTGLPWSGEDHIFELQVKSGAGTLLVDGAIVETGSMGAGDIAALTLFTNGAVFAPASAKRLLAYSVVLANPDATAARAYLTETYEL